MTASQKYRAAFYAEGRGCVAEGFGSSRSTAMARAAEALEDAKQIRARLDNRVDDYGDLRLLVGPAGA